MVNQLLDSVVCQFNGNSIFYGIEMLRKFPVTCPYVLFFYVIVVISIRSVNNENIQDAKVQVDSPNACASVNCNRGEHCVKRKFWCKHPPCPNMIYCSRTQRESWKGPSTCDSVHCSRGYICLVKVHGCRWDHKCRQQIARCITEREYNDSPASCVGFRCQTGHRCILRESPCSEPPCRLVKTCAKTEDVRKWHNRCKTLGCPSEYECFLRKPLNNCPLLQPCKHTSDCTIKITNVKRVPVNPNCQGWICPRDQKCSALQIPESCNPEKSIGSCRVNRTCHGHVDATSSSPTKLIPRVPTTAPNIPDSSSQINIPEEENERQRAEMNWQITNATTGHVNSSLSITVRASEQLVTIPTESFPRQPDRPTKQFEPILDSRHAPTPSRRDFNCNQNESVLFRGKWSAQTEPRNLQLASIFRTPVYVRSTVKKNITESVEPSCQDQRADPSIAEWLDHLRLKTGVDAVDAWAKYAEENKENGQFNEWMESVKSTLGPSQFQIWLTEFRKSMSGYPAFQDWFSTTEETFPFVERQKNTENKTTESPFISYTTLVTDGYESSTSRPPKRNENKSNSFIKPTDDPSIVSVTQQSFNHLLERKNIGHPRINYGSDSRNMHQQMHRGYIESHRNLRPVESKIVPPTESDILNSTQYPFALKEEINTTVSKLGHLIDFLKPEKIIESNLSQNNSTNFLTQQQKSVENGTRLEYNRTNHSLLPHETKENVEKLGYTLVGFTDKEYKQSDSTTSTLVSPVDSLAKLDENPQHNERQGYQVDPLKRDVVRDGQLQNFSSDKKYGPQDSLTHNYDAHIPTYGLGLIAIPPESGNPTTLPNFSVDNVEPKKIEDSTERQNLFAPIANGLPVTSPWNALQILDPSKKTYYALLRFPQEQHDDQVQIIGYPLIVSRTSSTDQSNSFFHIANVTPNPKSSIWQSKIGSSDSWDQIVMRQQIFREVFPQISNPPPLDEKGEHNNSRNQKSSSQQKPEQHESMRFRNLSEFVPLQDRRIAQMQHEQNLSSDKKIISTNRSQQMERRPPVSTQSLSASVESQNPNYRKMYQVVQIPKSPLQNHGVEVVRGKQNLRQQKKEALLSSAFLNDYPDYPYRGIQQLSPSVQNTDPTSSSLKNWYQRDGETPHHPAVINHYPSLDSTLMKDTPSPVNPQNEGINNSEDGFEENSADLNLQEYFDTYLDALIKDAVLKLLIAESLQENGTPVDGIKSENPSSFSQNIYDAITETVDDKYHKRFPQLRAKNLFSDEKQSKGLSPNIAHSVETVQKMEHILTNEPQQARITSISNPSVSPSVMEIDHQYYDCEQDQKMEVSPTVEIVKSSAAEDGDNVGSESYGVHEYYYEDEMQRDYLDMTLENGEAKDFGNHKSNMTNHYDSHYYGEEK